MEKNPAGWLVKAIEDGYPAPKGFESKADRAKRLEAQLERERTAAMKARRQRDEETQRERERQGVEEFINRLDPDERAALEAETLAQAPEETRRSYETASMPPFRRAMLLTLLREYVATKLRREDLTPLQPPVQSPAQVLGAEATPIAQEALQEDLTPMIAPRCPAAEGPASVIDP